MSVLTVAIPGPAPGKGSKRAVVRRGRAFVVDDNDHGLRAWESIALDRMLPLRPEVALDCPCACRVVVAVKRPRCHYRANGSLRPSAPALPSTGRDLDKVARAVLDCLTAAGWLRDDARVCDLAVFRRYEDGEGEHVVVAFRPAEPEGQG